MTATFANVQTILAAADPVVPPALHAPPGDSGGVGGLLRALRDRAAGKPVEPGDWAGLIRHVLRSEAERRPGGNGGTGAALRVPAGPGWPGRALWTESSVEVLSGDATHLRVRAAEAWRPAWLPGADRHPPLAAAFRGDQRRRGTEGTRPPLDPAARRVLPGRFETYSCPGQRAAVRSAMLLRPGGTLLVDLPTGAGKSLVAWLPALLAGPRALTVMITPTVALALDQENQAREAAGDTESGGGPNPLSHRLAFHGTLPKEEKADLLERIDAGTQRVVIAAPESLVGTLSGPLHRAAGRGELALLVVDEAHIVADWGGDAFRPEFQSMAGLRRALLRACPPGRRFRTLLLSATLPADSIALLRNLFADILFADAAGPGGMTDDAAGGGWEVVSAAVLRPEPEYWFAAADSEEDRAARVRELVRVVPRPFLLYVTKVDDAKRWGGELRAMGLRRFACVHGGSSDRQGVVDAWRDGDLDAVVATSAFGLGMDKGDVRAVLHACVPESVDRYYQEVGRAGRDGRAAAAALVYTRKDLGIALRLAEQKVIGVEKGRERWDVMLAGATPTAGADGSADIAAGGSAGDSADGAGVGTRVTVRTDALPARVGGPSDRNAAWNLSTLNLLTRAGFLRPDAPPPAELTRGEDETPEAFNDRRRAAEDDRRASVPVELLVDDHLSAAAWAARVGPARRRMRAAADEGVAAMRRLLEPGADVGRELAAAYRVEHPGVADAGVRATGPAGTVCSGCPACRAAGRPAAPVSPPPAARVAAPPAPATPELLALVGAGRGAAGGCVFVACPSGSDGRDVPRVLLTKMLPALAAAGAGEFAVPADWLRRWSAAFPRDLAAFAAKAPGGFPMLADPPAGPAGPSRGSAGPAAPRVSCVLARPAEPVPGALLDLDRPLHVIFAWDDAPDRDRPGRRYFDRVPHARWSGVLRRAGEALAAGGIHAAGGISGGGSR